MQSIEQSNTFHMVRRVAKLIAPDYRVFATLQLQPQDCVLDLAQKTIEVGENTEPLQAAVAVLFQLGHIRLQESPDFAEHSGKFPEAINETRLISKLVKQGLKADKLAAQWATEILISTFNVPENNAKALTKSFCWSEEDWKTYYSA